MRIKQLEYLEAVIETGSINEAAKRLYLTQPFKRDQGFRKRNGNHNLSKKQLRSPFNC